MKKFIKWFLFSLFVCGSLALAICYMVIPDRTKCAMDIVVGYLNTPLGIVGGTTITVGMVAYIVVSYVLKLHRQKALNDFNECKEELENKKKELESEIAKQKELIDEQAKKLLELKELLKQNSDFINGTLKLIPNKKVQERLKQSNETKERVND